jgi:ribulose-phosphate 3-epimerase
MGLAIKPATPLPDWAKKRLDRLSCLIVMTVNPGFSGQAMDPTVMPKLASISKFIEDHSLETDVEIDGGVEPENVHEVVKRGGNVLVAGAGIYGREDPVKAIGLLRRRALAAVRRR